MVVKPEASERARIEDQVARLCAWSAMYSIVKPSMDLNQDR